jgi:hypothetical protein
MQLGPFFLSKSNPQNFLTSATKKCEKINHRAHREHREEKERGRERERKRNQQQKNKPQSTQRAQRRERERKRKREKRNLYLNVFGRVADFAPGGALTSTAPGAAQRNPGYYEN